MSGLGHNTQSAPEGTHGPHSSRVANALDPRVDSDRDHRAAPSATHGLQGATGTAGPHSSNIANKLDPRVDSDRDHAAPLSSHAAPLSSNTAAYAGSVPQGVHGPHSSRVANTVDPRVDSNLDGSRTVGGTYGTTTGATTATTGLHGTNATTTHHGLAGTTAAHKSGPGPAPNTAGPHKSDLLNKLDPRVDSDLDGSKTLGSDKTFKSRDPTDAAQVPPSVLRKHLGDPVIEHGDHSHDRDRRNSLASAQETYRGI